jgi:hypothetical protein
VASTKAEISRTPRRRREDNVVNPPSSMSRDGRRSK